MNAELELLGQFTRALFCASRTAFLAALVWRFPRQPTGEKSPAYGVAAVLAWRWAVSFGWIVQYPQPLVRRD
ncbi:hypothetical protein LAD59_13630 [Klebsiella pneumoniae]|nr:hypothetical protein [Klebsiella pneumoniae]